MTEKTGQIKLTPVKAGGDNEEDLGNEEEIVIEAEEQEAITGSPKKPVVPRRRTIKTDDVALIAELLSGNLLKTLKAEVERGIRARDETADWVKRITSSERDVVRDVLREMLKDGSRAELPILDRIVMDTKPQHKNMPLLLEAMRARIPVWIYGDTGSGKTTAAAAAATALELEFRFISVCPTTTKSELFGYMDAHGTYHPTAFREVYENGGVFLIDEIDNGNPSILSVLNAALANDACSFPDGNIRRHESALFIAAANTIGRGADTRYVGRNALDATTLDRFAYVRMDIDENMENGITGGDYKPEPVDVKAGGSYTVEQWRTFVRMVRGACHELGIDHIVSPRAMIYGTKLLQCGLGKAHVADMCVWKGIREADRKKIQAHVTKGAKSGGGDV